MAALPSMEPVDQSSRNGRLLLEQGTSPWRKGYVLCGDHKVSLPERYRDLAQPILEHGIRDDDVWVVSHPKTGTTWTQEMVWLIGHDLDYAGAKVKQMERFPMLELSVLYDYRDIPMPDVPEFVTDALGYCERLPGPRYVKTHLPFQLIPKQLQDPKCKAKIVYVCRNAKDTCVSYFHYWRLLHGYTGNFDDFCELFLDGLVPFGPFWPHVLDFWKRRDQPNILFITYEQLKQDLAGVIRRTADFLGKKMSADQVDKLKDYLSFESMKKNPAVNWEEYLADKRKNKLAPEEGSFMRSGSVGNWKAHMSPEQSQRFDEWSARHLKGTGLQL